MNNLKLSDQLGKEDLDLHNEIESLRIVEDNYDKGIWERKIATHWKEIQDLTIKGLSKSRDLMLASRLVESTCYLENLEGVLQAILIFKEVAKDEYYPLDEDFRERIHVWFDQKLPLICFFNSGFFNIYQKQSYSKSKIKEQLDNILLAIKTMCFSTENFQNHIHKIIDTIDLVEKNQNTKKNLNLEDNEKNEISQIIHKK